MATKARREQKKKILPIEYIALRFNPLPKVGGPPLHTIPAGLIIVSDGQGFYDICSYDHEQRRYCDAASGEPKDLQREIFYWAELPLSLKTTPGR